MIFDFGGVIAEEGFREGLKAIARSNGMDENIFFKQAEKLIYSTGYVLGKVPECAYWNALRELTGLKYSDDVLRNELMLRFTIRPRMIEIVKKIRTEYCPVGILSDQTDWLDRIDEKYHIFQYFDFVFNSFYLGKGKRDKSLFGDISNRLSLKPEKILFIDDNSGHCKRAKLSNYQVIVYTDHDLFVKAITNIFPEISQ
ncbi:MAG: HAD hydrolase-like protein [Deltaproteobacteria bacterium]|nr:HAD hydrolase-like protein [Deltaproteobacteria bacterium]